MIILNLVGGKTLEVDANDIRKLIRGEENQSLVWVNDNTQPLVCTNPFPALLDTVHGMVTINHNINEVTL